MINTETGESVDDVCRTDVPMRQYRDEEIDDYIATRDPMDKAGAYAIQACGFSPGGRIDRLLCIGDGTTVVSPDGRVP